MIQANNRDRTFAVMERHALGLGTVELALLVAEFVLLGDLEGRLAAAGPGHGIGDLRELGPGVTVDLLLGLDALYRSALGLLGRLLGGGVRRGGRDESSYVAHNKGTNRKRKRSDQQPPLKHFLMFRMAESFLLTTGHPNPKRCFSNSVAQH